MMITQSINRLAVLGPRVKKTLLLSVASLYQNQRSIMTSRRTDISAEARSIGDAITLFRHGTNAVIPDKLIQKHVSLKGSVISIKNEVYLNLNEYGNLYVVGFGKAVLPMAEEILFILKDKVKRCVISVPHGTRPSNHSKIEMYRGARNNIPDLEAQHATTKIVELAMSCSENDLVLVLVTGGGSALLPLPCPPVTLREKLELVKELSRAGANIVELNSVRKQISLVKGGKLVGLCPAKRICSLILSDVLGDRLDIIASGPTVYSQGSGESALEIVKRIIPQASVPQTVLQVLQEPYTQMPSDLFNRVSNIIIGSNEIALREIASKVLEGSTSVPVILSSTLEGEARIVGKQLAHLSSLVSDFLSNEIHSNSEEDLVQVARQLEINENVIQNLILEIKKARAVRSGLVLLLGGEMTVKVTGKGVGGRNQELVLAAALSLHNLKHSENITILSAGTDGIDGPCDAAGALATCNTIPSAVEAGLNAVEFLQNNDSYNFFKKLENGKYHLTTGHTGTNVMDIVISIINF